MTIRCKYWQMDTHTDKVAFDMIYPQNIQLTLTERQNSMCYIIMQSFKIFVSCFVLKIFYLYWNRLFFFFQSLQCQQIPYESFQFCLYRHLHWELLLLLYKGITERGLNSMSCAALDIQCLYWNTLIIFFSKFDQKISNSLYIQ